LKKNPWRFYASPCERLISFAVIPLLFVAPAKIPKMGRPQSLFFNIHAPFKLPSHFFLNLLQATLGFSSGSRKIEEQRALIYQERKVTP
jgi:hypothetical protein